jgi:hypothetical protein
MQIELINDGLTPAERAASEAFFNWESLGYKSAWNAIVEVLTPMLAGKWISAPNEAAWWWHWNGQDYSVRFIYHVQHRRCGTVDRYFVDYPDSRWCDEIGGFWLKVQYPNVPTREEQKAIPAPKKEKQSGA